MLHRRMIFATAVLSSAAVASSAEVAERLRPVEIQSTRSIEAGPGTSGVAGMKTRVLLGDPAKPGIYTIEIEVPPHTMIQAHHHRDDRAASVVSGLWYIGYGPKREESQLKELPGGSFYTEPGGMAHFAGTKEKPAVVRITGFGPSDTVYVDAGTAPAATAPTPTAAQNHIVLQQALSNAPGKTLTVVEVNYAPGGTSPPHRHAGGVFAYVVSGQVRSENSATGPVRVYNAGEGFFEPPGSTHLVSANASTTEPATLLAVFVADEGAELTSPAK